MSIITTPKTPNISGQLARIKGIADSPAVKANLAKVQEASQQAVKACEAGRKAAQAFVK